MINSEWYPADFSDYQCKALDAAAEVVNTEDLTELKPYIKAIRSGNFQFLPNVNDYYDLGYANREVTGLNEDLEHFFDWNPLETRLILTMTVILRPMVGLRFSAIKAVSTMRKKIDSWLYDNCWECVLGLFIGEFLAAITLYPF